MFEFNKTSIDRIPIKLNFLFDEEFIVSEPFTLDFLLSPMNQPLTLEKYTDHHWVFNVFSWILIVVAWIVLIFSIVLKKYAGIELMVAFQMIFFCKQISFVNNPALIYTDSPLIYANGYNHFMQD